MENPTFTVVPSAIGRYKRPNAEGSSSNGFIAAGHLGLTFDIFSPAR